MHRFSNDYEEASFQHPEAQYVAFAKNAFGEGAERFAFRFYEVAGDRKTILGKPMVAKESKYVIQHDQDGVGVEWQRQKYVRTFCKTQQISRRLSIKFNRKLDKLKRVHPQTPRLHFLDCCIYELDDSAFVKLSVLVEDRLDENEWHKWNDNAGRVDGRLPPGTDENTFRLVANGFLPVHSNLNTLEEVSDDESEDDDSDNDLGFGPSFYPPPVIFSPSTVAQAFSHFTYLETGKTRLVCDLQGVFDAKSNALLLSDPVIHYYDPRKPDRRCIYGYSDLGRKGHRTFFETHYSCHGLLCNLVIRGFKNAASNQINASTHQIQTKTTQTRLYAISKLSIIY